MRVPTYLNENSYKLISMDDVFSKLEICNKSEDGQVNNIYEIYYFGSVSLDHMISGNYNEDGMVDMPCIIVARCIHSGEEILLYDQGKHGYNALFCDEINMDQLKERKLEKLDIPNSKIVMELAYNIDYDEEKEDFEFDEDDFTETINGERISFDSVKKDGFDYIKITAIDEIGKKRIICDLELA